MMSLAYGTEVRKFEDLLWEVYGATRNDLPRLAMMGIRALLEQVMIIKIGDKGTFSANLSAFYEAGYVSWVQFEAINRILDAGHAAMHRGYVPKEEHLNTALDVIEGSNRCYLCA